MTEYENGCLFGRELIYYDVSLDKSFFSKNSFPKSLYDEVDTNK